MNRAGYDHTQHIIDEMTNKIRRSLRSPKTTTTKKKHTKKTLVTAHHNTLLGLGPNT